MIKFVYVYVYEIAPRTKKACVSKSSVGYLVTSNWSRIESGAGSSFYPVTEGSNLIMQNLQHSVEKCTNQHIRVLDKIPSVKR